MPKNLVIATFNDRVHKGYTIFHEATAHKGYNICVLFFRHCSHACVNIMHFKFTFYALLLRCDIPLYEAEDMI